MQSHAQKPIGSVMLPAILCALTGSILAVGMDLMGYFSAVKAWLYEVWQAEPFLMSESFVVTQYVNWALTVVVSLLVALATLDSANLWRRLLIGAMSLVLLLGAAPCLVLWGVEWMPMMPVVALIWTWCCALMYASQHRMPCDSLREELDEQSLELKVETIPFPIKKKVN
ncbi:hypothetical protein [Rubritalea sp.]|uniref:hypothetical protein n=1 Tax=Rubritalea sp. TaxID=2109375 RepID=UPI003F4AC81F